MARLRDGTEETELPENGSNEIHAIIQNCWEMDHKTRPSFQHLVPQLEALLDDEHKKYYHLLADRFKSQFIESNRIFRRDPPARDSKSTASSGDNSRPKTSSITNKPTKAELTSPTAANLPASEKSYITIIPEDKSAVNENDGYLQPRLQPQPPQQPVSKFKLIANNNNRTPVTNNDDYLIPTSSKKVSCKKTMFYVNL